MKIFWVVKARKLLLMLLACFAAAVLIYSCSLQPGLSCPGEKGSAVHGHVLDPKSPGWEEEVARLTQNLCQHRWMPNMIPSTKVSSRISTGLKSMWPKPQK